MPQCVTLKCTNKEMTEKERETQFLAGWVGITMYDHICFACFDQLKEEIQKWKIILAVLVVRSANHRTELSQQTQGFQSSLIEPNSAPHRTKSKDRNPARGRGVTHRLMRSDTERVTNA